MRALARVPWTKKGREDLLSPREAITSHCSASVTDRIGCLSVLLDASADLIVVDVRLQEGLQRCHRSVAGRDRLIGGNDDPQAALQADGLDVVAFSHALMACRIRFSCFWAVVPLPQALAGACNTPSNDLP